MSGPRPGLLAAATIVVLLAACGERDFDAPTLVEELNAEGAGLELGEPLSASADGPEVHAVRLAHEEEGHEEADRGNERDAEGDHGHDHGGGAVAILDGVEEARVEFERCQAAVSFTCFRASNAVLRFEGLEPEDRARLESALVAVSGGQ